MRETGRIEDGPWARTLAAFGKRGRSGQLTVRTADGKVYAIAFAHGMVVGATSPMAVDSVARIASSLHLPVAAAFPARVRRGAGGPDAEVDAYLAAVKLAPDQVKLLKHRLLVQRAARTFAIERGQYAFEPRVTISVVLGVEVDVRAVVFAGALLHVDGGRMTTELAGVGARFAIADGAELARFELGDAEAPVVAALRAGSSVPEVEAQHRQIDPRRVLAVFYALATCGTLETLPPRDPPAMRALAKGSVEMTRLDTPQGAMWVRLPTGSDALDPTVPTLFEPGEAREIRPPAEASCVPMLIRRDVEVSMQASGAAGAEVEAPPPRAAGKRARTKRVHTEPFLEARPTTMRPNALSASELRELIAARSRAVELGADHFEVLGVPVGASVEAVRAAYIELARNLRSERLVELRIHDQEFRARRLFAQLCIAYTVLTDPARRADYVSGLQRSAAPGVADVDFAQLAREAFDRGARALRADDPELAVAELRTACELVPNDIRYLATLGHAEFSAAAAASRKR